LEIRRKILFLITSLEDRGTENAALRLAVGMERTGGYLPEILALKEGSGRLRIRAEAEGFERLSSLGLTSARSLITAVLALRAKVLAERIDVLYSFLFHPNIVARLAGRLAGLCLVINGERSVPGGVMAFRSLVRRWSAFLPHGYTAVSDAVRAEMINVLGTPIDRVRTIRNGVDATRFPERTGFLASRERIRLLAIGSFSPEKSFGTLVEALKLLGDGSVGLTILGDGPGRQSLEAQIGAAGLSGRIVLPGHTADILPYLQDADIYVQSSIREGLSNALLAAMTSGLPCVATDVGGSREAVTDGETGILVPAAAPAVLARGIRKIIDRPEEGRRLGRNARLRMIREFSSKRELEETVNWIEELLRRRSAGTAPATSRT
jgi:glycosyltransferase involved in cell wall biosynthesis